MFSHTYCASHFCLMSEILTVNSELLLLIHCKPFVCSQVPVEPQIARHASLYHQVALVVLPWLLPGSEYLAHELISTIVFSKDFIS